MSAQDYAFVRGMADTRGALRRWNARPGEILGDWLRLAFAIAVALLAAVLMVSYLKAPGHAKFSLPGLTDDASAADVASVLGRNSLVLALHAAACIAGFIAGSSLPLQAERQTGFSRWMHERARPVALGWVIGVICFSLTSQAYYLGSSGSTLAAQLEISRLALVLSVLPHAIPELMALFLPLAAWTIASRRDEWSSLLAATAVTVGVAIPVLVVAATWEVYVWPHILAALSPVV